MSIFGKIKSFFKGFADERFIMHRYKATRVSVVVTAFAMAAMLNYYYIVEHVIKKDIVILMSVMVVSKLIAMTYYRFTN
jgi:hypothetical protein